MIRFTTVACRCGSCQLEVTGEPIINAECHCNSCRAAAAEFLALPASEPVTGTSGGTHFVLYRKDRVRFVTEHDKLKALKLASDSKTVRAVATCCNTPVFMELPGGHWLSLYAGLWPKDQLPPLDERTMVKDRPDKGAALPDDVRNASSQSPRFMWRLLTAWIGMGFRAPKVEVNGELERDGPAVAATPTKHG